MFAGGLRSLSDDIHQLEEEVRLKTTLSGASASAPAAEAAVRFLDECARREAPELEERLRRRRAEGEQMAEEMPVHAATIRQGKEMKFPKWSENIFCTNIEWA